jgi:hypothetical protein
MSIPPIRIPVVRITLALSRPAGEVQDRRTAGL